MIFFIRLLVAKMKISIKLVILLHLFNQLINVQSQLNNTCSPVDETNVEEWVEMDDQIVTDLDYADYNAVALPNLEDEFCEYINKTCPQIRTYSGVPVRNKKTKKLHIGIQVVPIKLLEVNEIEESFSMRIDLRISWGLPRCANWKDGIKLGTDAPQRLHDAFRNNKSPSTCYFRKEWMYVPLLLHTNAMGDPYAIEKTGNKKIQVFQRGVASMINKNRFDSMCSLDFTFFPFDTQQCYMEISAFSTDILIAGVAFEIGPSSDFIGNNKIWELVSKNATIVTGVTYSNARFVLQLSRRPNYHLLLIMGPTVVLTFLQLAVFLLPFDVPERSSYSITVVLAMQISISAVYGEIPVTSQPVYLANYVAVCQMIGAIMTMYVNGAVRLAERKKRIGKRIVLLDFIIGCCFAFFVLLLNIVVFTAVTMKIYI